MNILLFTLFLPIVLNASHLPHRAEAWITQVTAQRESKPSATVRKPARNRCDPTRATGKLKRTVQSKYYVLFQKYCPEQMDWLPATCYSENRGQVDDAVGPGGRGACMVGPIHQWRAGSGSLMDPETNVKVACSIAREQGGGPWTDYCNGYWNNYTITP